MKKRIITAERKQHLAEMKSIIYQLEESTDFLKLVNTYRFANFDISSNNEYISFLYDRLEPYLSVFPDIVEIATNVLNSRYKRKQRLYKRIESYTTISKNCVFLTLTFSSDYLETTTPQQRRDDIRLFLKSISDYYVGNIDFGNHDDYFDLQGNERTGTDREHYHAIVTERVSKELADYYRSKYGLIHFEKIRTGTHDKQKLSTYITKLTNHALKDSTKRSALIYSRKPLLAI